MQKLPNTIEVPVIVQHARTLKLDCLKYAVVSSCYKGKVYAIFYFRDHALDYAKNRMSDGEVINIQTGETIYPTSPANDN